ncbi:MAG: cell division protein FtsA [Candidatus Cardinium sp.]|uniref:cell division protein FtsA n=1 Tax=Cardinium endosymbiont of Dermatophagoides farinae TaxID=2597823 RepID=UPI001182D931|nr:cell division protein FtsA [Cardinium endosymbiont of Dermatophagoides farinae]TSJ81214.1 cell division protein FtsA [Cardinium endosymbiont of Dermatophagoides farinae]UWW97264.1 MAG: cell division protein FtsA [Candidatus Cardinium sp.]
MSEIIASLDIGTSKICVVIGAQSQYDAGKLEVLGMGTAAADGMVRGMIVNIDKAAIAIKQALQAAEEDSGININVVNVNVSGKHVAGSCHHGSITRDTVEEEITVEDIKKLTSDMYRIVTPLGTEIVHAVPQEYTIDYEIVIQDPVGMLGVKLEANFHLITAKTHAIQNIHKCIKKAGVEAEMVMASGLAASLALLSDEEKEAGVCLIDFGGSIINLVIFCDAIIRYTATIPLGGHMITSDIQQSCMVMERQAELLKVKFGNIEPNAAQAVITIPGLRNRAPKEVASTNLTKIIAARVEEMVTFIHEEMLRSGFYEKLVAGIVVTGGTANLPGIQSIVQQITGLDTRLGFPDEYLEEGSRKQLRDPSYATAVGLALAGFKTLDYREAYYRAAQSADLNFTKKNTKKVKKSSFSFARMITKTKAFLVDDYDDN